MSELKNTQSFVLSSGHSCQIHPIKRGFIKHYYLLAFPKTQGEPAASEVTEMLGFGVRFAQQKALEVLGDPEAFSMLYSGYSARREKGWHVHIVLLGNRWAKAKLYWVLAGKNCLQALRLRKDDAPRLRQ